MPIVKHAVIAAAGLGSRLGHGKPKCLVEIEGLSVLEHQLGLLRDVEDVRVVVGFEEKHVIDAVRRLRRTAIVVRNPAFRSTTTLHSYAMGASHLRGDCLFMDGDMYVLPHTMEAFLASCRVGSPLLGIVSSRTNDAVYVAIAGDRVMGFSRETKTEYEWANVAWLPVSIFEDIGNTPVYVHLEKWLPMQALAIESFEIDTKADLEAASRHRQSFSA